MKIKKISLGIFFIGIIFVVFFFNQNDRDFQQVKAIAESSHNVSGYAWSENIGWISFNCASGPDTCGEFDYGVNIENNKLSGYAWSENIGWISFEEDDLSGCPEGSCSATFDGSEIKGWAKALSADENGWDGWISLGKQSSEGTEYGVSLVGTNFSGYAWGSDVIGWISFNCSDLDTCSTSDYKVTYGDYEKPVINYFNVTNVINGNSPTISFGASNADSCSGIWEGVSNPLCSGETDCASYSVEGPKVTERMEYTLTCENTGGSVTETEEPLLYYTLDFVEGYSGRVAVDFVVSGATTTETKIGVTPWNGFGSDVTLTTDLDNASPEALPDGSYPIYSNKTLFPSEYSDGSEFSIFISEPITRTHTVLVTGNDSSMFGEGVEVTIQGEGLSPKWKEF